MRKTFALTAALLTAGCMAERPMQMSADGQARLAAAIEGRVASPPQSCVQMREVRGNESVGNGAILFRGTSSNVVYLNQPAGGCPELRLGRALKVTTTMSQLCSGDIVEVFDPVSGIDYGGCTLGEFTPYRRVR